MQAAAETPGSEEATVADQVDRRRLATASQWSLSREIVVIGSGDPVPVPGRGDRMYPFRSHSEYLYLTDRERPGGVLAFDPADGWVDFVVPVTHDELLWEGWSTGGNVVNACWASEAFGSSRTCSSPTMASMFSPTTFRCCDR